MWFRIACLLAAATASLHADAAVLESWLKRQASIETLSVEFTQERRLPALKQPVSATGTLSFSKPGRVRWQLGDPPATLAVSDGAKFTLIDYAGRTARTLPADSPRAARFSLLTGKGFQAPAEFHAAFEVAGHRIDQGIHQFTLRPRERRVRAQVPWIFLHIDPDRNELRALEIELQDRSRIHTRFRQPVLNRKLPASLFQPDLDGLTVK